MKKILVSVIVIVLLNGCFYWGSFARGFNGGQLTTSEQEEYKRLQQEESAKYQGLQAVLPNMVSLEDPINIKYKDDIITYKKISCDKQNVLWKGIKGGDRFYSDCYTNAENTFKSYEENINKYIEIFAKMDKIEGIDINAAAQMFTRLESVNRYAQNTENSGTLASWMNSSYYAKDGAAIVNAVTVPLIAAQLSNEWQKETIDRRQLIINNKQKSALSILSLMHKEGYNMASPLFYGNSMWFLLYAMSNNINMTDVDFSNVLIQFTGPGHQVNMPSAYTFAKLSVTSALDAYTLEFVTSAQKNKVIYSILKQMLML